MALVADTESDSFWWSNISAVFPKTGSADSKTSIYLKKAFQSSWQNPVEAEHQAKEWLGLAYLHRV